MVAFSAAYREERLDSHYSVAIAFSKHSLLSGPQTQSGLLTFPVLRLGRRRWRREETTGAGPIQARTAGGRMI